MKNTQFPLYHNLFIITSSSLIRPPPDLSLLGLLYQHVPEIRMGYGYQRLRSLPCGTPFKIYHAVLCRQKIHLTSRRGDDISVELWLYPGMLHSIPVGVGGTHADKRLAATRARCSDQEIKLSAGPADLA